MRCPHCANVVVSIQLTIKSENVEFHRCARCDIGTWAGASGELSRDGILELVRSSL